MKKTFYTTIIKILGVLLVILLVSVVLLLQRNSVGGRSDENGGSEVLAEVSPEPTPVPTPPSTMRYGNENTEPTTAEKKHVAEILESMSQREKICQLFIVYPDAITQVKPTTKAGEITLDAYVRYPVGGFVFSAKNLISQEQISSFISTMQENAKIKLFMCADEEGGRVTRLMGNIGTTEFEPMLSYQYSGIETAYSNAKTIAQEMNGLGFNLDLAPVADVFSNLENTVIGDRAYSTDFVTASQLVPWAVNGFHDGGVNCCLKHFPGHGDTLEDTHDGLAFTNKTKEELAQQELLGFKTGIDAGADMVMIGHMTVSEYSDQPSTLSKEIVTDLLRGELGYDGVIITDALNMGAIKAMGTAKIVVGALNAGCDILLGPDSIFNAVSAIENAVERGELSQKQIDESVSRILLLKLRSGIIE